ncbi:MAG: BrnT family toxin [Betaproteobacteria bacterium]
MTTLHFEWDEPKDKANIAKHGVSFNDAKTVFYDDCARLISDPDHSKDEERFILLGCSSSLKLLIVCHCYRSNDGVIRLISARKATKHEAATY